MARKRRTSKSTGSQKTSTSDKTTNNESVKSTSNADNNSDSKGEEIKGKVNPANDPAWYSRDEALLRDAANLPFSLPFGAEVPLFPTDSPIPGVTSTPLIGKNYPIPGVCSLVIKPSMGTNLSKSSPANVCANALYTHVRYVNSGRKNYDPADLFFYVTAFGEIYSYLVWNIRNYNYAYMYSQRNWYIGKDLLLANGVDPEDIVANLANYRYWINSMINKISSFCIPGDIDYFRRRVWVFSNYYLENPYNNIKDQLYQLVPEGFYKFEYDSEFNAGKLKYLRMPNVEGEGTMTVLMKWTKLVEIFEDLMSNITGDEDFGLMSGDILKAYGDNIVHLGQIEPEAGLLPVYDPYVLSQFKNAVCVPWLHRGNDEKVWTDELGHTHVYGDIEQMTNGLIASVESYDFSGGGEDFKLFKGTMVSMVHPCSVENPVPGPGDVIEATRFIVSCDTFKDGDTSNYCLNCGSDIVLYIRMTMVPYNRAAGEFPSAPWMPSLYYKGTSNPDPYWLVITDHFKYIPLSYVMHINADNTLDTMRLYSNVENIAMITNEINKRLHEVALLSLFYVPGVAKIV